LGGSDTDLQWICETCKDFNGKSHCKNDVSAERQKIDRKLENNLTKLASLDDALQNKIDRTELMVVQTRMEEFELKLTSIVEAMDQLKQANLNSIKKLDVSKREIIDVMKVKDCVQQVVEIQSQEERDEKIERLKTNTSVIVQGVHESSAESAKERLDDAHMLHELECDSAKIMKCFRLGWKPDQSETAMLKPGPLKIVFKTEDQKHKY
jgi:hypothetical protein